MSRFISLVYLTHPHLPTRIHPHTYPSLIPLFIPHPPTLSYLPIIIPCPLQKCLVNSANDKSLTSTLSVTSSIAAAIRTGAPWLHITIRNRIVPCAAQGAMPPRAFSSPCIDSALVVGKTVISTSTSPAVFLGRGRAPRAMKSRPLFSTLRIR